MNNPIIANHQHNQSIYLANFFVDMRKSIDGLSLLVCEHFQQNPASGSIFVFLNKSRNKIKILYFDRNGFTLWYKRLERGRFILSKTLDQQVYELTEAQLRWLLDGLDFTSLRGHPTLYYDTFA